MDKEHRFFEKYAPTWDHDRNEDAEQLRFLLQFVRLSEGDTVLDVGSGTGVLVPYVTACIGKTGQLTELDYSEAMLARAKEKFTAVPNLSFLSGNVLTIPLAEQAYDAVLCLNFYPHIQRQGQDFMKRMYKALKVGGKLAIMHDISRQTVNAIHDDMTPLDTAPLPPVDVLSAMLMSAGFTIVTALDMPEYYLVVAEKKEILSSAYQEPVETDSMTHLQAHLQGIPHSHSHGHHHSHTQTKIVMNRLARISGHLEAIKRMIDDGRDCSDVLMQLSAVDSAIVSVSKVILKDHIDHCIVDAIRENDLEAVENLKKAISTFVK